MFQKVGTMTQQDAPQLATRRTGRMLDTPKAAKLSGPSKTSTVDHVLWEKTFLPKQQAIVPTIHCSRGPTYPSFQTRLAATCGYSRLFVADSKEFSPSHTAIIPTKHTSVEERPCATKAPFYSNRSAKSGSGLWRACGARS